MSTPIKGVYDGLGNATGIAEFISTDTIPIINGGTGQSTANNAFNALAPSTTKGDIIVRDSTTNIRLGIGTNNQVLTADSTTASGLKWGAIPTTSPTLSSLGPVIYESDFLEGTVTGDVGGFKYTPGTGGSGAFIASTASHPGIFSFTASSSGDTSLYLGGQVLASDIDTFEVILRRNNVTSTSTVGYGDTTNGIYFNISASTTYCYCISNNVATQNSLGTTYFGPNVWTHIKIVKNGSAYDFYVNGAVRSSISTNIPTTSMGVGLKFLFNSGGTFDVDYMGIKTQAMTQRY